MKAFCISVALLIVHQTNIAQKKINRYTLDKINWTIIVPASFTVMDSVENDKINKTGKKAMESVTGNKANHSKEKTLISATKGDRDYFSISVAPFKGKNESWKQANETQKKILYKTFKEKIPNAVFDSGSSSTKIDGIDFDRFYLKISIPGNFILNMNLLSKLYKGLDLGISYLYSNEVSKQEIENMLKNSAFAKK